MSARTLQQMSFFTLLSAFIDAMLVNGVRDTYGNSLIPMLPKRTLINAPDPDVVGYAVGVVIAFILAMIATIIGANLIGPVATAVGGALNNKNLTGAANSLTSQITLIFVTVVIVGIVTFLALFGGIAGKGSTVGSKLE